MTTNRIVLLLSPILLSLAGWIVVLAARYLPGHPQLDQHEVFELFLAGAGLAAAKLLMWLRGWQAHEARESPRSSM